jgi:hypothetical protein
MDEEIFGEGWKQLSKSKILPKRKTTKGITTILLFFVILFQVGNKS